MKCHSAFSEVVERLEADLGVTVQKVQLPGLRYSFQIWDTYMALPDKGGKVSLSDTLIQVKSKCRRCS